MDSTQANIASGVLDSISAGILMYTALVELIAHEVSFLVSAKPLTAQCPSLTTVLSLSISSSLTPTGRRRAWVNFAMPSPALLLERLSWPSSASGRSAAISLLNEIDRPSADAHLTPSHDYLRMTVFACPFIPGLLQARNDYGVPHPCCMYSSKRKRC